MPLTIKIFRAVVLSSLLLFSLNFWVLPYVGIPQSELHAGLLAWDGTDAMVQAGPAFYALLWAAGAAPAVGMLFFVPFSRQVFALLTVGFVVLDFAYGLRVMRPIDVAFEHVIALLDGAALAIAYLVPSVASRFQGDRD